MNLEEIENLKQSILNRDDDILESMDIDELHRELHTLIKNREALETAKKWYVKSSNDTLKLIKARITRVTQEIDKVENIIEKEFPTEQAV